MTYTTQVLSRVTIENAEKTVEPKEVEGTCDILAVCESLNKLCDALSRLDYAIKRKNGEISFTKRSV